MRKKRDGAVQFLTHWYQSHCDGEWEHEFGVKIDTLDNPGWSIEVDLVGTELEGRQLAIKKVNDEAPSWVHAWADGEKFHAASGPDGLLDAFGIFEAFATEARRVAG